MNKLSIFISHPSEFITNCQPHGDGLAAFQFIYSLAQRGHTLHVAVQSMDIKGNLPNNIKLYPVKVSIPFSTLNPIEYMIRVRQIFNYVHHNYGVDIIQQLNPVNPGLSYSLLNTGVPIVLGLFVPGWTSESEPPQLKGSLLGTISSTFFTYPLLRWCDRQQQKNATALLLSTPAALTQVYKPEASESKIYYLPYGINTSAFSPTNNQSFQTIEKLSILYLASLNQRKGIFTLLEAFEQVIKVLPSCKLIIAGAGKELERVKQKISKMSCGSHISLLGNVIREQVPELMRQCTVYCLPSYGEPFGISALEAMSCGKPVVATNAGGLAHLVPDQGGFKVPMKDANALAKALIEILSSPKQQLEMGQYNRQIVEEKYNWEAVVEKLESIYYKLLDSTNS